MELEINQKKQDFSLEKICAHANGEQQVTLDRLMAYLYPDSTEGLAVAMGSQVIARSAWPGTYLKQGDNILILTATQGG